MYEEREIDLVSMGRYLIKKSWFIAVGIVIGFGISLCYMYTHQSKGGWQLQMSYAIPSVYQEGDNIIGIGGDIATNVSDYIRSSLINSDGISVETSVTGRTIAITYLNKDEEITRKTAQQIEDVMAGEVPLTFSINAPINTLNTVTKVEQSLNKKYVFAGSLLGLCIPLFILVVLYVVQNRVWTENEILRKYRSNTTVLNLDNEKKDRHNEEVLFMLSNYVVSMHTNPVVVSVQPGEGKTYLCERMLEYGSKGGKLIDNSFVLQEGASTLKACELADVVLFVVESGKNSARTIDYYLNLLDKMGKETYIIINKCKR